MHNEKIAEKLLAQIRSPQDAYEYAIPRKNGLEYSRKMEINPFVGQPATIKLKPVHYINVRGRYN